MPPTLSLVDGATIESWADPEIRAYFLDSYRHAVPPPTSLSLEAHQPDVLRGFARFWWMAFHQGVVDRQLKERLRVEIAEQAGCAYCATTQLPEPTRDDGMAANRPGPAGGAASALAFARRLATEPWALGESDIAALRRDWPPEAWVEIVLFCAWQYGGPRVLRSWGADSYKRDGQLRLDDLPVRLAYRDEAGTPPTWPARPTRPVEEVLGEADRDGSPPRGWLDLLAPRPDLLVAWADLYRATVHGRTLPPRVGQLVRLDLARQLACPEWAPADSPALRAAAPGIGMADLSRLDPDRFDALERAALGYVRAVVADRPADEVEASDPARVLSEGQRVELGFALAVQLGPALVYRSLVRPPGFGLAGALAPVVGDATT